MLYFVDVFSVLAVTGIFCLGAFFAVNRYWREKWFALAWTYLRFSSYVDWRTRKMKLNWMIQADIRGRVIDIGSGDGINLKYLLLFKNKIDSITLVEPNVSLHTKLLERAKQLQLSVQLFNGTVEEYVRQNPTVKFDTVTGIFVLCSVDNPEEVIGDFYSMLKPGGLLFILEHVKETRGGILNLIQILFQPIHLYYGGNCHLRRCYDSTLKKYDFDNVKEQYLSSFTTGMPWLANFYGFIGFKREN